MRDEWGFRGFIDLQRPLQPQPDRLLAKLVYFRETDQGVQLIQYDQLRN